VTGRLPRSRPTWVSRESLRRWAKQLDIDEGRAEGLTSDEREELIRLRKENRVLREESDILKRVTACASRM
jgi:transposase